MKKVIGLLVALVMTLGAMPVFASEVVEEGYTYKVILDTTSGYSAGTVMLVDENHDVKDFVVVTETSYGYIYIPVDTEYNIEAYCVNVEKVANEDLGVSGDHVYEMDGYRTYDRLIDESAPVSVVENPSSVDFE